ncbi:hypothetical protein [Bradyrhizobium sp. ORS 111]|uniref:hypothetical protein n=1 Tax=Bradyrhizobium sp. ORS 111 TaxID=1685958 RepID=UPI00388E5B03
MIKHDNRASDLSASQSRTVWNFWPLAALLLNALLWILICWAIAWAFAVFF